MTIEKVTVTKDVAAAIEEFRELGRSNSEIFIKAVDDTPLANDAEWAIFDWVNGAGEDSLMSALINGYEVEKSPEEIITEAYAELSDYETNDRACKDSFRFVLDTLGIKIEGVNAE